MHLVLFLSETEFSPIISPYVVIFSSESLVGLIHYCRKPMPHCSYQQVQLLRKISVFLILHSRRVSSVGFCSCSSQILRAQKWKRRLESRTIFEKIRTSSLTRTISAKIRTISDIVPEHQVPSLVKKSPFLPTKYLLQKERKSVIRTVAVVTA